MQFATLPGGFHARVNLIRETANAARTLGVMRRVAMEEAEAGASQQPASPGPVSRRVPSMRGDFQRSLSGGGDFCEAVSASSSGTESSMSSPGSSHQGGAGEREEIALLGPRPAGGDVDAGGATLVAGGIARPDEDGECSEFSRALGGVHRRHLTPFPSLFETHK